MLFSPPRETHLTGLGNPTLLVKAYTVTRFQFNLAVPQLSLKFVADYGPEDDGRIVVQDMVDYWNASLGATACLLQYLRHR